MMSSPRDAAPRPIRPLASLGLLLLFILLMAFAPGAQAQTAYIEGLQWNSQTDANSDGFFENCVLDMNIDETGGWGVTVFEKIWYRASGTGSWKLQQTTANHTVIGNDDSDNTYAVVTVPSKNYYDFKVEVYRSGHSSPDDWQDNSTNTILYHVPMDTPDSGGGDDGGGGGGGGGTVIIADAWWSNKADVDSDGYWESARLNWNPDVTVADSSQKVYEKLYFRPYGDTNWYWFLDTTPHTIIGSDPADSQYIDFPATTRSIMDFKIEVYRDGQGAADNSRSPANDSDLSYCKFGPKGSNGNWVTIKDASWTNEADQDGDNYKESARLVWDANVANGLNTQTVFEKIYYRTAGTTTWTYYGQHANHTITGTNVDTTYYDIFPSFSAGFYDFRIEIYRVGQTSPDYVRDPFTDADLSWYPMGTSDNYGDQVALGDIWWSNTVDLNNNGFKSALRLHWDPNVNAGKDNQYVYAKVFYKRSSSSTWSLYSTTTNQRINATDPDDKWVDFNAIPDQDYWDFKIELYRTGQTTPDATLNPINNTSLSHVGMESYGEDDPANAVTLPQFSPDPAVTYISPISVTMATTTSLSTIRYTVASNGTVPPDPTKASGTYSLPLYLSYGTTIIKAKAWKATHGPSAITSATYHIRMPVHVINRTLPAGYLPAVALPVKIDVVPDPVTTQWSFDEAPPMGWTVSAINAGGTYDAAARQIKWGPFTDATTRTLTYQVTPPFTESGIKSFSGYPSMQGQLFDVGGDAMLNRLADATPPAVAAITCLDANLISTATARFGVVFSEPVAGVDVSDFLIFAGGALTGTQVLSVSGGPTAYVVTVNTGSGSGTLRLDLAASGTGILDASANPIAGGFTAGDAYTIDHLPPTFGSASASPALAGLGIPVQIQFTASEALQSSPTLTVNGAAAALLAHAGLSYTFQYTIRSADPDGAATVIIRGTDIAGNPGSLTTTALLTIDKTPPPPPTSLTLDGADDSGLSSGDAITNHSTALTVRGSAEPGSTVQLWEGASLVGALPAAAFASTGLDLSLAEGSHSLIAVAVDGAGNISPASAPLVIRVDQTAPTPGSASSASYARTSPIRVSYTGAGDAQSGLRQVELWVKVGNGAWQDSGLRATSAAGAFDYAPGSEAIHAFAVVAEDVAGNRSATPAGAGMTQTVYDTTAPHVLSINRVDVSPTNAATVRFTVSFSEPVTGLDAGDFIVSASGLASSQVAGVAGGPADYTVTVNSGVGDGTLRLDLAGTLTGIQDSAGNPLASGYNAGQSYRVDRVPPTFGSLSASPSPAALNALVSISFTASEALMTSPTVTVGGVAVPIQFHTGLNYICQLTVKSSDPDGPATVAVSGIDYAGNVGSYNSGSLLVIDKTAPAAPTGLTLDATDDAGFSGSDKITNHATALSVRGSAEAGSTVQLWEGSTLLASGSAATFNSTGLDVNLAEGIHGLTATATDAAGNSSAASATLTIQVDQSIPTISPASCPSSAKASPIHVSYYGANDSGSGLHHVELWVKADAGAWTDSGLKSTAAAGGFDFIPTVAATYAFAVVAEDVAGNRSAAPVGSGDDQTVYDPVFPQVLSLTRLDASPTSATTVRYAVTFSKAVTGVDPDDFTGTVLSGALPGLQITGLTGGPTAYTVMLNTGGGDGQLRLDLRASGSGIQDLSGNLLQTGLIGQVYVLDHLTPVFNALNVSPSPAFPGTVVYLNFTASEALATSPTLTVNGNAATAYNHSALNYTFRYTIKATDPDGPATVIVTGADPIGHPGRLNDTSALAVDSGLPSSNLLPTSAMVDHDTLSLKWQAADAPLKGYASGVARIDLYCAKNYDLPFKVGSFDAASTGTIFDLRLYGGYSQYHFYTVAVDAAGNTEPAPDTPDWTYTPNYPKNAVGQGWQRYQ